jgi:hypothetical protein
MPAETGREGATNSAFFSGRRAKQHSSTDGAIAWKAAVRSARTGLAQPGESTSEPADLTLRSYHAEAAVAPDTHRASIAFIEGCSTRGSVRPRTATLQATARPLALAERTVEGEMKREPMLALQLPHLSSRCGQLLEPGRRRRFRSPDGQAGTQVERAFSWRVRTIG